MSDQIGVLGTSESSKPKPPPVPLKPTNKKKITGHERWAGKIDAHFRKEMLELQVIENAQPIEENESMLYLVNIYKNYIDQYFQGSCAKCLARILKHFRDMRPYLIDLEKNANLLKSLK